MVEEINNWLTDSEVLSILGRRIKEKRLQQNIKQEELAHEVGVHKLTIAKLEKGKGCKLETFIKVIRFFSDFDKLNSLLSTENLSLKEEFYRDKKKKKQRARTKSND